MVSLSNQTSAKPAPTPSTDGVGPETAEVGDLGYRRAVPTRASRLASRKDSGDSLRPPENVRNKSYAAAPGFSNDGAAARTRDAKSLSVAEERLEGGGYGRPRGRLYASATSGSLGSTLSRMRSAIRPEFSRIAASILLAISGLALRKVFAFSRPCPRRVLS